MIAKEKRVWYDYGVLVLRRSDGIGRRTGLKIRRWRHRAGSTPAFGTSRCVGIGRQDRLRIYCAMRTWGFDSPHRHQYSYHFVGFADREGIFRSGEIIRSFLFLMYSFRNQLAAVFFEKCVSQLPPAQPCSVYPSGAM